MSEESKIQNTLDILLELHDDKKSLKRIKWLGQLQHVNIAQSAIAGIVRYLFEIRDGKEYKLWLINTE